MQKLTAYGASGAAYQYEVYPFGTALVAMPGNYIVARYVGGNYHALYVGEAQSLSDRCCPGHHKWDEVRRRGATHILAHTSSEDRRLRLSEETDLRRKLLPPCNDQ